MNKRKKLWVPIVSGLLLVALIAGLAVYFANRRGDPVLVYNIQDMYLYTDYWGDTNTTYGPVRTDKLQAVYLSNTQEVTQIQVQQGQRVSKGDPILTYDTTLSQLTLDRKELEIQRAKLRLEDAEDQLAAIKKMKPSSYTTVPTTTAKPTTSPSDGQPTTNLDADEKFRVLSGAGTAGDPKIIWVRQSTVFDDDLMEELLDGGDSLYMVLEVRTGDRASGTVTSRTGVFLQMTLETVTAAAPAAAALLPGEGEAPPTAAGTAQTEGGSSGVDFLTGTVTADPATEPEANPSTEPGTEPEANPSTEPGTEPDPTTDPTTEPSDPTDPTNPSEPVEIQVPRYSITFFQPSSTSSSTGSGSTGSGSSSGGIIYNPNSGYTASELATMRADKEQEIKDLEFSIKMAEAEYKIMQKEFDNGVVTSEVDGYVVSVAEDLEQARANNEPVVKISGGGGFYVEGSVDELKRETLQVGQTVDILSWDSGMTYQGTISAIGDYPTSQSNYSENPNVSYYPFTVTVDESADLQEGYYVEITYASNNPETDGFYLQACFVRSENGKSFVYVQNEEGVLEKREVQTGPSIWNGSYIKILSGLELTDNIAFPYGSNLKEGAPTQPGESSDLYPSYY